MNLGYNFKHVNDHEPRFGRTPLMMAIMLGFKDYAIQLIHTGADVNALDNNGNNALHHLFGFRHEVEEHAEEARIAKERKLDSYKFLARKDPDPDLLEVLLEKGADISHRNKSGKAPKDFVWECDKSTWSQRISQDGAKQELARFL